MSRRGVRGGIHKDQRGATAVEFALVMPLLLLVLLGIVSYGGYFWTAHSVQQLANDGARAAIAGLTAQERAQIAQSTVQNELDSYGVLQSNLTTVAVSDVADRLAINVAFDASQSFFFAFADIIPMPPSNISRAAAVRLGGY